MQTSDQNHVYVVHEHVIVPGLGLLASNISYVMHTSTIRDLESLGLRIKQVSKSWLNWSEIMLTE